MNLHETLFFMGLPSTISLMAFVFPQFKNAHYTGLGVWVGVLYKFYIEGIDLSFFIIIPIFFITFHLINIIKNEKMKKWFVGRLKNLRVLLTEKDQRDSDSTKQGQNHL